MSNPLYSLDQLKELAGGSQEFVQTMIDTFVEHTPDQMQSMYEAFESKNYSRMGELAHKIKPSIDLFDIDGLKDIIRSIERQGKNNEPLPDLNAQMEQVKSTLSQAIDQLKSL